MIFFQNRRLVAFNTDRQTEKEKKKKHKYGGRVHKEESKLLGVKNLTRILLVWLCWYL
jgi:hypothetical protein